MGANPASDVPGGTISIALADVNGDGLTDLVVADQVSVKVQLGNGDGTFQPPLSFKSGGARPLSVAVADFNGDGFPDIAVANECSSLVNGACASTGSVGVLAGNGDGTFQLPVKYLSGGKSATSIAVGDVDGDTKFDLFVSNVCVSLSNCANGTVAVFVNIFKASVTVQVSSSINPSIIHQPFEVSATLVSAVPVPDGSDVDFFYNGTLLGSASTTSGTATLIGVVFNVFGPHTITAKYAGDLYHLASSGTMTQQVHRYDTSTTLISSLNPSAVNQKVTFTATVTSTGPSAPTGSVQFFKNGSLLGSAPLSGGMAKFQKTFTTAGTSSITATYAGDSQSAPSTSSPVIQTVN